MIWTADLDPQIQRLLAEMSATPLGELVDILILAAQERVHASLTTLRCQNLGCSERALHARRLLAQAHDSLLAADRLVRRSAA